MAQLLERAAHNHLYEAGPAVHAINEHVPPVAVSFTAPCVLLKAIAFHESSWRQFCANCGESGLTVINSSCAYGVMQILSGMGGGAGFDPARVASETAYDIGAGLVMLSEKWRMTPSVGNNMPTIVEDWYYSTWAYNDWVWGNNPNNPNFPANRPPYNGPGGLSVGKYPYQEAVWGLMRNPTTTAGAAWWPAVEVSYPDNSAICATSGCAPGRIPDPTPTHADPCQTTFVDQAELTAESPANPIAAGEGGSVAKTWTLTNTGDMVWSADAGYSFVCASADCLGGPASVDLSGSYHYGQKVDLTVTLSATTAGSHTATYHLESASTKVGPDLVATLVITADDAAVSSLDAEEGTDAAGAYFDAQGIGLDAAVSETDAQVGLDAQASPSGDRGPTAAAPVSAGCGCAASDGAAIGLAPLLLLAMRRPRSNRPSLKG
jgi:MYXO-CTERM domain-containing protein